MTSATAMTRIINRSMFFGSLTFFTKARCYGALIGIVRDKSYEDKIEELEADNKRLAENLAAVVKTDEDKSQSFEAVK
jgi:hypothetical protein